MIILLFIFLFCVILALVGMYWDARYNSGCNARISFKLFKTMYERFPNKWYLRENYVQFYYEYERKDTLGTFTDTYIDIKEFRGYFNLPDLIRYWFYKHDVEKETRKKREETDYADVIKAFEDLEKKVK